MRRKKTKFIDDGGVDRYGFEWPSRDERETRIQVVRTASIDHGERGRTRVIAVVTARQAIDVYVSPTGVIRVFKDHRELKVQTASGIIDGRTT